MITQVIQCLDMLFLDKCMMADKVLDIFSCRVNVVDHDLVIFFQYFLEIFPSQHDPIYLMRLEDDE